MSVRIFAAYPSSPKEIGESFKLLDVDSNFSSSGVHFRSWEAISGTGRLIDEAILPHIKNADIVAVDITTPNYNVYFEAGYALGLGKSVIPFVNTGLKRNNYLRTVGIFDNVIYENYENHNDIKRIILQNLNNPPPMFRERKVSHEQPIYVLDSLKRTEFASKIISSVKASKLFFRSHDPAEVYRLSFRDAFRAVDSSAGIILSFLSNAKEDWEFHNLKASFLFGLSMGMTKKCLMIVDGSIDIPLDFIDWVKPVKHPDDISAYIDDFSNKVDLDVYKDSLSNRSPTTEIKDVTLGASAAENEFRSLEKYYVETSAFKAALQGRARLMVGRKGSGKTAIFWRVRDIVRRPKNNLVLDLKPEGYQLQKFKEFSVNHLTEGTKSHAITAFWEYVILSEIVRKIFENDERYIGRNPQITDKLERLRSVYLSFKDGIEGDFSERLLHLINQVTESFKKTKSSGAIEAIQLTDAQITSLIYKNPIKDIYAHVSDYLQAKDEVLILVDNIDKGWGADGISHDDATIVQSLISALERIQKSFVKSSVNFRWLLFLRNDVYELVLENQSDRGKDERVLVDWENKEALRAVINNRINFGIRSGTRKSFKDYATSFVEGEDSLTWLIDRCVMRPRYLINLVDACFGQATSARRNSIYEEDILSAFKSASIDMISDTNFEMRDVAPDSYDSIYSLIGSSEILRSEELLDLLLSNYSDNTSNAAEAERLLYWFGVLGFVDRNKNKKYIYDFRYDEKIFTKHRLQSQNENSLVVVNPAFAAGLECTSVDL